RDEPHADAELYRRLHVIVGDSSMAEPTTMLNVGTTDLVLRLVEAGVQMRDLTLENPIRAIREISHDRTGKHAVTLADGRSTPAGESQAAYYEPAEELVEANLEVTPVVKQVLDLWERGLRALQSDDLSLIARELDSAIKRKLTRRYPEKHGMSLDDPR